MRGRAAGAYAATVERTSRGMLLRFKPGESFPAPLSVIRDNTSPDDKELRGVLDDVEFTNGTARTAVTFAPVRFVKLNAITNAAFDFAKTAVTMALGFIGGLALWLGLVQIADRSGLVNLVALAARAEVRDLLGIGDAAAVASRLLRTIQRFVGEPDDGFAIARHARVRDAEARGEDGRVRREMRLRQRRPQAVDHFRRPLRRDRRQQQRELLAAPADHVIAIAHHAAGRVGE